MSRLEQEPAEVMTGKKHGGVRRGAGRPRSLTPPLRKTAVTLEEWRVDWLRRYGDGSVSAGVRRLIDEKCKKE